MKFNPRPDERRGGDEEEEGGGERDDDDILEKELKKKRERNIPPSVDLLPECNISRPAYLPAPGKKLQSQMGTALCRVIVFFSLSLSLSLSIREWYTRVNYRV